MPHFQNEMFRRIWWCIYVLDRRLCLETGRPFFIMDLNNDTELPSNLSDVWLSGHRSRKETVSDLRMAIAEETQQSENTQTLYLNAMVEYSRITGKAWKAVYASPHAEESLNDVHIEYVELYLDRWKESLPPSLVYHEARMRQKVESEPTRAVTLQSFLLYLVTKLIPMLSWPHLHH